MILWRVTIKQQLPRRRYALHQYAVLAETAEAAKQRAVETHRPTLNWSVEAEIEDDGIIMGTSSTHHLPSLDRYTKGGRQYDR